MNRFKLILLITFCLFALFKAYPKGGENTFIKEVEVKYTLVKDQGSTGTCWSFATTSFIESELLRLGKGEYDLSEMYFVAQTYKGKIKQYFFYYGNNNLSEGGLAHDVLNIVRNFGIMPDSVYPGIKIDGKFQHHEFAEELKKKADRLNSRKKGFNLKKIKPLENMIEYNIGKIPKNFSFRGKKYDPITFKNYLEFNPDNYIEITSFTHHPFYESFVLEIPDNWAHQSYYNLPIEELIQVIYSAFNKGYSIAWDGDTSEKTISHNKGFGDLPDSEIGKVTQELRQDLYIKRKTTDDHLMHMVGIAKNQDGRTFFITKNSWGRTSNRFDGMIHLSEDYVKLKTISILVHKDAVPEEIAKKLNLL